MCAKSKVAPIKPVSLPRLELCASHLLARLTAHVVRTLGLQAPIHLWSDSTIALTWITAHPSRWKTYVANRVADIQSTVPSARWHHIAGKENPADCASRGLAPSALSTFGLWWHGPSWLSSSPGPWTTHTMTETAADVPEQRRPPVASHVATVAEPDLLRRYSSLSRLLRITAWCRRAMRRLPSAVGDERDEATGNEVRPLAAAELEAALKAWIRVVQSEFFKDALNTLQNKALLRSGGSLAKLSPFIDQLGIMRVGGRLKHSLLSFDEKHPIILPEDSALTHLIVDACHRRALHGGVQLTLSILRQRYWISRGRMVVKRHIHRCLPCIRWRAAVPQQIMGGLPHPRVNASRPFQHTGVDYAGPVMLRTSRGRGHKAHKAFFVVFVCLGTKAVHLEVASDYTAAGFLAAFRRFVSRRGLSTSALPG
ncbi:PREDICTED: uncharacterized protein LOC105556358 [Vollenhovia emeryi]|uniref:uncharacterized protein LOC105556358 n=1 Tax=Vollenhovia emeryi TaxID=411798 RepID=UPI0005F552A3|nr:PREDICTED: uncharacterized protein LOC105556358 [Vollenhovia emeryi]